MKIIVDTQATGARFLVTAEPTEKQDNNGRVRADRDTGEVLWTTELLVREEGNTRSELIRVTTVGKPDVTMDQRVVPAALEALYWTNTGNDGKQRSGIAWRAKSIEPVQVPSAEKSSEKPVKAAS